MKKVLTIEGMHCNHCQAKVENALSHVEGVQDVKVKLAKGEAIVHMEDGKDLDEKMKKAIEEVGFSVVKIEEKKGLFS